MNNSRISIVFIIFLLTGAFVTRAQDWQQVKGIASDISVTALCEDDNNIVAFGIRMWREGVNYYSEPKSFISKDNGESWSEYVKLDKGFTTVNTLLISNDRLITSGRKGEPQLDWEGALCYSDDNGATWTEVSSIPSDIAITKIQKYGNTIMAFGQKQWREGYQVFSEPKAFISTDNGSTWNPFIEITKELSTSNSLLLSNGRIITSGRLGQVQMDWIGAVFYTDDNGITWKKAEGLPSELSTTDIKEYQGKLIAVGHRQWREGYQYYSEPKSYISEDNGSTWKEYLTITGDLTSISTMLISNDRLFVSGRFGPTQMDWVGAMFYLNLK